MADKTTDTTSTGIGNTTKLVANSTNTDPAADLTGQQRPIGEVHDALIAESEKQAQFNRDSHALQVEANNRLQQRSGVEAPYDPDEARANALATQKAVLAEQNSAPAADTSKKADASKSKTATN